MSDKLPPQVPAVDAMQESIDSIWTLMERRTLEEIPLPVPAALPSVHSWWEFDSMIVSASRRRLQEECERYILGTGRILYSQGMRIDPISISPHGEVPFHGMEKVTLYELSRPLENKPKVKITPCVSDRLLNAYYEKFGKPSEEVE